MGKRNPVEDANLLYVALVIIVVILSTILIVAIISNQEDDSIFQTEKALSGIKVEPLSSNSFEICLKITNNGFSIVEREDLSFHWENEKTNPKIISQSCLRKGECLVVKIENRIGELKIFCNNKLIYSHYFP